MENPKCLYCGATMALHLNMGFYSYYCPSCYAEAPAANSLASAYAAAMKREKVRGEWIDFGDELDKSAGRHSYQCSNCFTDASFFISGFEWDEWTAPHFCPNCGAEMREEANDER